MILYNIYIKTFAVNTIGDVISPSKKINIGFPVPYIIHFGETPGMPD